jgi:hypothetical protein
MFADRIDDHVRKYAETPLVHRSGLIADLDKAVFGVALWARLQAAHAIGDGFEHGEG